MDTFALSDTLPLCCMLILLAACSHNDRRQASVGPQTLPMTHDDENSMVCYESISDAVAMSVRAKRVYQLNGGTPITLTIRVSLDREFHLMSHYAPEDDFRIELVDRDGHPVERLKASTTGGHGYERVGPQGLSRSLDLSEIFKLNSSGQYSVRFKAYLHCGNEVAVIESPIIPFSVAR